MLNTISLTGLQPGQHAVIARLDTCGTMRRRLQDVGLIRGTPVTCTLRSPLGDPCAFLVRGAVIALRREDADTVKVLRGVGKERAHDRS